MTTKFYKYLGLILVKISCVFSFVSFSQEVPNAWQPSLNEIKFKGVDSRQFSIDSKSFDEDAIVRHVLKGENDIGQYIADISLDTLSSSVSFELRFEDGFIFPLRDHKLPLGLWGGESSSSCFSGGCNVDVQDGFSVRLVESNGRPYLYIYSLNRDSKVQKNGKMYGQLIGGDIEYVFPKNKWVSVVITIKLASDISLLDTVELTIDGVSMIKSNTVKLREDQEWLIKGPMLTDLYGGTVSAYSNKSRKAQRLWYKNYTIVSL